MRRLCLALAALALVPAAHAGTELLVEMQRGAEAKITVGSCFNHLPPAGYAPVDIKIENSSTEPRAWAFDFATSQRGYGNAITSHAELGVPAKSARSFRLIVPLALAPDAYGSPLKVEVSGPGTNQLSTAQFPPLARKSKPLGAFIGMSEPLTARFGSRLEEESKHSTQQLAMTTFRSADLPEDWRALVGFTAFWMTEEEVAQLSAGQRNALHDWFYRGGQLFISGASAAGLALPETGFGKVTVVPAELDVAETWSTIRRLEPALETHLSEQYTRGSGWEAIRAIGDIEVNVLLLIGFIAVFGAVSGPANLFVFAPAGRRHRLFWTTPAISLVASLVLALLIVLQDGFGGTGHRLALIHVIPAERKQVVLQEQVARTGVLRSSAFTTADPTFIAPIALEPRGVGARHEAFNADRHFDGWFKSRTLQAQWLESITSTRAEVALLNPAELRDKTAPPVILSSIDAPLEELYYFDEHGGVWRATSVRPGEKSTLQQSSIGLLLPDEAGPRLKAMWESVWQKRGHFYAKSNAAGALVATLPSIRWEQQRALYFGAVTTAAPAP